MIRRRIREKTYAVTLFKDAEISRRMVVTYVGYKALSKSSDTIPVVNVKSDIVVVNVTLPADMPPTIDNFEEHTNNSYIKTLLNDNYRIIAWSETI